MAIFSYKGTDIKGEVVEDTIQASNREDAIAALKSTGLTILSLRSADSGLSMVSGRVSLAEKVVFCRFMSTMIRSGLSIPEALEIMRAETKKGKLKKILSDLSFQTQKGKNLTSVLSQYKEDFDSIFITMVKVGEESGTLQKSFEYLTKQLNASYELTQKIRGALMYPAVIVVAMLGNGMIMMFFVLPKISSVFLKLDTPLPLPTKIVLTAGNFIGTHIPLTLAAMLGSGFFIFLLFYIRATRHFFLENFLKLPYVSSVIHQIDIARFARTLSTLLRSGVPITNSLDVASEGIADMKVKALAKKFSEGVSKGESLSAVLSKNASLFPPIMIQTIKAGEKTGSLDEILDEMATFYENEVEYSVKRATSRTSPMNVAFSGSVTPIVA
jgi:type II secretory pathway component PulF